MSEDLLPLFPLQVVLLPNAILPLHISEERYKQLINECLAEEGKEFGINLAKENEVAKVGCTAAVTKLVRRYSDGRMDILVEGRRRYALQKIVPSSDIHYNLGRVAFLGSTEEMGDGALAMEAVDLHNQLVGLVYKGMGCELDYGRENTFLSFRIARKAGMELGQRQALLEMDSENARLKFLRDYFTEVIPKLEKLEEVERVIKSDGYL